MCDKPKDFDKSAFNLIMETQNERVKSLLYF